MCKSRQCLARVGLSRSSHFSAASLPRESCMCTPRRVIVPARAVAAGQQRRNAGGQRLGLCCSQSQHMLLMTTAMCRQSIGNTVAAGAAEST